jgi:hypothetical protein
MKGWVVQTSDSLRDFDMTKWYIDFENWTQKTLAQSEAKFNVSSSGFHIPLMNATSSTLVLWAINLNKERDYLLGGLIVIERQKK